VYMCVYVCMCAMHKDYPCRHRINALHDA